MGPSQLTESLDIQSNIEAFSFAAYLSFLPRLMRKRQEKSTKSSTKINENDYFGCVLSPQSAC